MENKHVALARCSKDFRLESSSCFCSDVPDARAQESLWLDDLFLFDDNAEYRAGCWLCQAFGGSCGKGAVIMENYPVGGEQRCCQLSPEMFPHKGKNWASFLGVIQERVMDWGLGQARVRLQGLLRKSGRTCGSLHPHTSSVLSDAFQEGFAKPLVNSVGSAEGEGVVHPLRELILPYRGIAIQWEWRVFSSWVPVPSFTPLQARASRSPLTLSRLTWVCTCAF